MRSLHGRHRGMRFGVAIGVGFVAAAGSFVAHAANVSTDLSQRYQEIDGFGTTLAFFRDELGPDRSQYNSESFYDFYYGDMGGSIVRMEMLYTVLSDFKAAQPSNAELVTPINMVADTYQNIDKFNFNAYGVGHIGQFVQQAASRALDDFKLHGAFWSPPHWMKGEEVNWSNGQPNGKQPTFTGYLQSSGGTLIDTPQNLEQFGRYTAAYVKGFELEFGVPLHSLSVQNEATFSVFYNSAVYTPELYVKTLKAIRDAFDAHNAMYPNDPILTQLVGPDDLGIGLVSNAGDGARAMRFVNAINDDPEARDALDFWVMHGFAGGVGKDGGSSAYRTWPTFYDGRQPEGGFDAPYWEGAGRDKKLWVSEQSSELQSWLTPQFSDRKGGLSVGMKIYQALVAGDVSAYLYWQTQIGDRPQDPPFQLTDDEDPDQPKYAAFKHFSKYVRPGAVRFEVTDDDDLLYVTGFEHDGNETLTYVLFNLDTTSETVTLNLPGGRDFTNALAVASEDGLYHDPVAVTLGADSVTLSLAPESMMTLVLEFLGSLPGDYDGSGQVEQGDLDLVLQNWGIDTDPPDGPTVRIAGWVNQFPDGVVDQDELDGVLQNWGGASAPDFGGLDVPEPVAGLLAMAIAGMALRNRRVH